MTPREVPFPPLELSPEEQQNCRDRVAQLLERTLLGYDERDGRGAGRPTIPLHHSNLDSADWKLLKTQEVASLYTKQHSETEDRNLLGVDWNDPVVILMVGRIRGDLDEVMLGIETPDFTALKTRSETFTKQAVDGAVLAELQGPTDDDPFRFMGVQWTVVDHSWPLKAMVRPRDFVSLASTGIMTRANGDRIGYEVVLPANLPQCPPLPKPVVRGQVMHAAIFRQQEPGVVDAYVHAYIETQNSLLDKVVVSVAWKSTIVFWDSPQLAEVKKLVWCIAHCSSQRQQAVQSSTRACGKCSEKRGRTKRRRSASIGDKNTCVLCSSPTCSDCLVERTFKVPDERKVKMADQRVFVCPECLAFVQQQEPAEIARLNQVERLKEGKRSSSTRDSESSEVWVY
ncbi:hypothetical protein PHYBOEH_009719 [Phytophthora boehmeriae]|uniref:FYVE-type domain-containing protein n=1 Tax=Phytophthora boehmeriae TaxID=109152 RepID=A0A8T1VRI7_9STRA|nr:hypothetical protein PHYBOEH_009719 [Phytophthora boehmeriae]